MNFQKMKIQLLLIALSLLFLSLAGWTLERWVGSKAAFRRVERAWQQAAQAPHILSQQQAKLSALQTQLHKQQAALKTGTALLRQVEAACRQQGVQLLSLPQERQLTGSDARFSELRFSLQGRLQDILQLSHRWEYQDRLGRLTYFRLARENLRQGPKKEPQLIASLRFKRLL